jgi:hypothetical protein
MRRWAARIAAGIGVVLLVLLGALIGAAYITARPADPMLWPPSPDAAKVEVVLVSNGYHAGLALPRATLAQYANERGYPALIAVTQRFAAFDWIEFGWGDREFYQSVPTVADISLPVALRALFSPGNTSVLHVVGITGARLHRRRSRAHPALAQRLRPDAAAARCHVRPAARRRAAGSRARPLRPEPVLSGERELQRLQGLQSLDRRPAWRRRAAEGAGARDPAARPDLSSALACGAEAYIFTALICTTGCTSV